MKLRKYILLLISSCTLCLSAQTTDNPVEVAKTYYTQHHYNEAFFVLFNYLKTHENDVYANWLYGQLAQDLKIFDISEHHLQKALGFQPENAEIRMAYGKTLLYSKQLKRASKEFNEIISSANNERYTAEAHLMLSYIDFWNMDLSKSQEHVDYILQRNPSDKLALEQKEAIRQMSFPYIKFNFEYLDDDQPLRSFSEKVEVGINHSRFLNLAFYIKNQNFNTYSQIVTGNLKNAFILSDLGMNISVSAGVSKHFKDKFDWNGSFELDKKIIENLNIKAGVNRGSYLHTTKSSYNTFAENNFYGIADYDNPDLFSANIIYQHKFFKENNYINTVGGWVMTKYFKHDFVQARAGYAVSYSDAKRSSFMPDIPIEIHPQEENLLGHYDSYFTPNNQIIHSLLGALKFDITSRLALDVSGGYGFYASNNAPLLFISEDLGDRLLMMRTFYKEKYHPYNVKVNLNYILSAKFNLGAYYEHQKTSFYQQEKAGVQLFYKF